MKIAKPRQKVRWLTEDPSTWYQPGDVAEVALVLRDYDDCRYDYMPHEQGTVAYVLVPDGAATYPFAWDAKRFEVVSDDTPLKRTEPEPYNPDDEED